MTHPLHTAIMANKQGEAVGIPSVCSANQFVLQAAVEFSRISPRCLCIESTARQVNQDGGYARMTPAKFAHFIRQISTRVKTEEGKILLGGDHLGPSPWQSENASTAMAKARELVRQCVIAGYRKLHLDPTMPCRDDIVDGRPGISLETIAERTASLCECAEAAAREIGEKHGRLMYVVGAEVPAPGGLHGNTLEIPVSTPENVEKMMGSMKQAFIGKGLEGAWHRCIAVVAETGAAFGPDIIHDYDGRKTKALKALIEKEKNIVFEAHSTDFQTEAALRDMVRDHFAILKVGPWLTFAAREGLFAMSHIETECLGKKKEITLSRLPDLMRDLMRKDKSHWRDHYSGKPDGPDYITLYGFSDRIRYYWSDPRCDNAIKHLFQNLTEYGIPLPLLSQYMPEAFDAVREGRITSKPDDLVRHKIFSILDTYARACGIN